jgi:hypothetical protein
MENTIQQQIQESLSKIENKDFGFYFFVMDTKNNPMAWVANVYEHAKTLTDLGYKTYILHEKNEYSSVEGWLGEEYSSLPHVSIESQELKVSSSDFLIIPEIFANVMEQTKKMPCKRIVFSQCYDYILEILNLGTSWTEYGITDVITTTEKQKNYINSLFPSVNVTTVPVGIPDYFSKSDKPQKPIVSISSRKQEDMLKIVKTFYLKNPMLKWVTFRDLRGIPKKNFAKTLSESCVSVWVDDISSFGTFPIESMKSGVPVIGKIPNMIPSWLEESDEQNNVMIRDNGIWTTDLTKIPDLVATYIRLWLEDNVPTDLYEKMDESVQGKYTMEEERKTIETVYTELINKRKMELVSLLTNNNTVNA